MKIIAIGDTHGRNYWKSIVDSNIFDKIVFIGDYFDTYDKISMLNQLSNFESILKYKADNPDKVVLLIGNHDYHYFRFVSEHYSCYQNRYGFAYGNILHEALDKGYIQMCYVHDKYLFTHAGVTRTWLDSVGYIDGDLESFINDMFKHKPSKFKFKAGINQSVYGDDVTQSPIWVRPDSLAIDPVNAMGDYIQVVGHTSQQHITIINDNIILIDTFNNSKEYLEIDNGILKILK